MYRVYAHDPQMRINAGIRRRLAPLLGNDRRKIELLNGLLLALPGTPVIYYGDEIGMGDNVYLGDRDAVRTPMQWSPDRNAGFSTANPQKLYLPTIIDPEFHYEMVNVEVQQAHENSLLPVDAPGAARAQPPPGARAGHVAHAAARQPPHRRLRALATRTSTCSWWPTSPARPSTPSSTCPTTPAPAPSSCSAAPSSPPVGDLPYLVTLGPYAFHWFALTRQETDAPGAGRRHRRAGAHARARRVPGTRSFDGPARRRLERPPAATTCARRRWFPGKDRAIASTSGSPTSCHLTTRGAAVPSYLVLVQVRFREGEPATFALPLAIVGGERADALARRAQPRRGGRAHAGPAARPACSARRCGSPRPRRALLDRCRSRRPRRGRVRGARRVAHPGAAPHDGRPRRPGPVRWCAASRATPRWWSATRRS